MYRLRPLEEKDKELFLNMFLSENTKTYKSSELHQLVRENVWQLETNKESKSNYMIIDDSSEAVCGYCVLIEDGDTPEIGIDLLPEYQAKGIGEVAIKQLIEINKNRDDISYFLIRIKNDNIPSIKLFKKLGAKPIDHRKPDFMQKLRSFVGSSEEFKEIIDNLEDDDKDTLCFAIYKD